MKLMIDIPEEKYNKFIYSDDIDEEELVEAFEYLANGTPIPDNATNGDVMISLYPNLKYTIQNGRVVTTIGVASSFDLDWWNAQYQKGGKE